MGSFESFNGRRNLDKCSVCGKYFIIDNKQEYVYHIGSRYFCSYTCFRKVQKEIEAKQKGPKLDIEW